MQTAHGVIARWLIVLGALAGVLMASIPVAPTALAGSSLVAQELSAVRPELREEIAAAAPVDLPTYELAVSFPSSGSDERVLQGSATVSYTNTTSAELDALPFRLYANGPDAEHDVIRIADVRAGDAPVDVAWSVDNSVATIPLPQPLAPGEAITVSMAFTTQVPEDGREHYGILNYASEPGTWALAQWYPILAGHDGDGWLLDPPSVNGDPVFSNTGIYRVSVTAPDAMALITSGVEVGSEPVGEGMRSVTFEAAPSRDFVMVASETMQPVTREVDGTTVISWFEPGDEAWGTAVAEWSARSLEIFNELLGPYPYRQLQLVPTPLFGAAGVEFPQLIFMDDAYYNDDLSRSAPTSFEFTVAHEVVHQWFYNLVGNNQYAHAYIDEGLTNYLSSEIYFGRAYDESVAQRVRSSYLERPYESAVDAGKDQIVDTPTDAFPSSDGYVMAAYSKAPLGFAAIRDLLGDDAFFAGLRDYVSSFRFQVATPADLRATLEQASGTDLGEVWTTWFERKDGE